MGFELRGKLSLDGSSFASGLQAAQRQVGIAATSLRSQLLGALGAAAIGMHAKQVIDYGGRLQDLGETWKTNTERLQEFDYAATQNGTTLEKLMTAQRNLAKARKEAIANPTGDKAKAFGQFGFDVDTLKGITDPSELLLRMSDAIKGAELDLNSIPQVLTLIGDKNAEVLPAMIAGLRQLGQEARDAGQVMGVETQKQLDAIGDALDRLKKRMTVGLGPVIVWLGEKIEEAFTGLVMIKTAMTSGTKNWEEFFAVGDRVRQELEKKREESRRSKKGSALDGFDDPEDLFTKIEKAQKAAEQRAKQTERIQEKEFRVKLAGMTDSEKLKALEDERKKITGEGLEAPSADQREKLAELDLQIQNQKNAIRGQFQAPAVDELARVGGFGPGTGFSSGEVHERTARATERTVEILTDIKTNPKELLP